MAFARGIDEWNRYVLMQQRFASHKLLHNHATTFDDNFYKKLRLSHCPLSPIELLDNLRLAIAAASMPFDVPATATAGAKDLNPPSAGAFNSPFVSMDGLGSPSLLSPSTGAASSTATATATAASGSSGSPVLRSWRAAHVAVLHSLAELRHTLTAARSISPLLLSFFENTRNRIVPASHGAHLRSTHRADGE